MNKETSQQKTPVVLLFVPFAPNETLLQHVEQKIGVSTDEVIFGALCESGENDLDGHRLSPEAATVLRQMFAVKNGMVVAAVIDGKNDVTIESSQEIFR